MPHAMCFCITYSGFRGQGHTCIVEPLLQQWLEFAHVLKAQIQGLKARDGSLAEVVSIQLPHGQANIALENGGRQRNMKNGNHNHFFSQQRYTNNMS